MPFIKSDFDNLDKAIQKIVEQPVEEIELNTELPPTIDKIQNNNVAYSIMATILFIDIRKSTDLTESSKAKSMVKVYRSFMRMAVECVRKNGGVTRNFLGDRIMAIFTDSYNDCGDIIEKSVDKAVICAKSMMTTIDYSLNKHLKSNVNNKTIECGIGIDYGKILITKVGMYGVEQDEEKENEVDCVWIGNVTNHASKYSDIANGGEIFISSNVYSNMSEYLKAEKWSVVTKYKGQKAFDGYISKDIYIDFSNELSEPVKHEESDYDSSENYKQIANALKEISKINEDLINREKDIEVQKEKNRLTREEQVKIIKELYTLIYDFLGLPFCNSSMINKTTTEFWLKIIDYLFKMGEKLGYSETYIKQTISHYLVEIYNALGLYSYSFEVTEIMAKEVSWVYLKKETLEWCKQNGKLWSLKWDINWRIEHDAKNIDIEDFRKYIKELEKYE